MNFNIQDIRRGIIDSSSSLGEILYVAVQNFPDGSTWPLLDVLSPRVGLSLDWGPVFLQPRFQHRREALRR